MRSPSPLLLAASSAQAGVDPPRSVAASGVPKGKPETACTSVSACAGARRVTPRVTPRRVARVASSSPPPLSAAAYRPRRWRWQRWVAATTPWWRECRCCSGAGGWLLAVARQRSEPRVQLQPVCPSVRGCSARQTDGRSSSDRRTDGRYASPRSRALCRWQRPSAPARPLPPRARDHSHLHVSRTSQASAGLPAAHPPRAGAASGRARPRRRGGVSELSAPARSGRGGNKVRRGHGPYHDRG